MSTLNNDYSSSYRILLRMIGFAAVVFGGVIFFQHKAQVNSVPLTPSLTVQYVTCDTQWCGFSSDGRDYYYIQMRGTPPVSKGTIIQLHGCKNRYCLRYEISGKEQ